MQSDLLLKVLKVGLLVERDLRHVAEVSPDLDAAKLEGRVQVQRLKVLLQVVAANLN